MVTSDQQGDVPYTLRPKLREVVTEQERHSGMLIWPRSLSWQEPVVQVGDRVVKRQLLASGTTQIYFQANVWVFTVISLALGAVMGIGMAAVYKHISVYYPQDVGVVGGIVGVLGGLGGFICPVIFGYLLSASGLWTTCWMFLFGLAAACLIWMHRVVLGLTRQAAPPSPSPSPRPIEEPFAPAGAGSAS